MRGGEGHVEVLDPAAAGEDIRCTWRRLAIRRENPFLTPEWFEAWHDAERETPWLVVWRRQEGGEVAAVMPLVLARGGGVRSLRFGGAEHGDWFGVASEPGDGPQAAGALLEGIRSARERWDVLWLNRVEDGDLHGDATGAEPGLRPFRPPDVLPYLDFGDGGYEGWLGSRSRNFRSQLGRRRRRAERDHELVFRGTPERGELGSALDTLFELHEARRTMQGGEGVLDGRAREAYGRFAALSLEQGWLRMHSLEIDGAPAAAWYGWRIGGRYCYGISGFDPAQEGLAVGTLLLAHTIESAAAEGAAVYDLLWGDESYKERYATGRRTVASLAEAAGARGRVALAGRRGYSRVTQAIPPATRRRLRALLARSGRG